jgi:hypothetical protein
MVPSSLNGSPGLGRWIVSRLGSNPAASLGLDPHRDEDLARWLVAVCLRSGRAGDEACVERSFRALSEKGLDTPAGVVGLGPRAVEAALLEARHPQAARAAARVARACRALLDDYGGSVERLASRADGLDELGARIAALAPGLGAASVAAYLRPLRDRWPDAAELPLSPAARAAAVHLGLIDEGQDEEGEPGALRAALGREPDAPDLADVEAALTRLGTRSCLRGRVDRCPLRDECPLRKP